MSNEMSERFNPGRYNLKKLQYFDTRWGNDESPDAMQEYMNDYNKVSTDDKIVAWEMGWTDADYMEDKVTLRFYIKKTKNAK